MTKSILLLADYTHCTMAVADHINAITQGSEFQWFVENPLICKTLHKLDFNMFDAIGLHYSIRPQRAYYMPKSLYRKIKAFSGTKFLLLQDEYQRVNDISDHMANLGMHVLFTLVRPEWVDRAYPDPRLRNMKKVTLLTAYVPDTLLNRETPKIADRKMDIFYRSRTCDFWLGKLAQEKVLIAEGVLNHASKYHLNVDISVQEKDRIYGKEWVKRLSNARAVLGTESGTHIWDFDGSIEKTVSRALCKKPNANFDEIHREFLEPHEGKLQYNAISPRIFEAAALRTPLIMFPGYYSGVCQPDQHYILLEKDFSNFADVALKLKDDHYLQNLADRAYDDLIASGKFAQKTMGETIARELENLMCKKEQDSSINIANTIITSKKKHRIQNAIFLLLAEIQFGTRNVFSILFDRRYPLSKKISTILSGIQRYLVYITPRITHFLKARKDKP